MLEISPSGSPESGGGESALFQKVEAFWAEQDGAAGVEYGLLAAFFVAIVMSVTQFFGDTLGDVQTEVAAALTGAAEQS